MRMLPVFLLLLFLAFGAPALHAAGESVSDTRKQLDEIETRIRETSGTLEKNKAAAQSLQTDLATVEKAASRLRARIKALEGESADLQASLEAKAREVEDVQARIDRSEAQVRRRLAALYKTGETGTLRILFSGTSPARMAEDHDFLGRIVRRDRELLVDFRKQLAQLEEGRRQLIVLSEQRQKSLTELQGEQDNLRRASRLKTDLLARARREEAALSARLRELQDRARRLGALIKQLESVKTPKYTQKALKEGSFGRQKGRLPWPAGGSVRVGFGTSRTAELGTLRESQGIELATPPEQPVAAVWPGSVVFAKWFKGFGNLLILDHGEGYYSLYAQAERLNRKVGDRVQTGDSLAVSGSDGIYFEIRHHGSPLDPAAWLAPR